MNYQLLNGCPAVVVPVKVGAPLLAWDTLTLEHLWKTPLPNDGETFEGTKFKGVTTVFYEFLDMCVDWDRVTLSRQQKESGENIKANEGDLDGDLKKKKKALGYALDVLVASAIRSGESKEVKKEIDGDRSGIAMWRIP